MYACSCHTTGHNRTKQNKTEQIRKRRGWARERKGRAMVWFSSPSILHNGKLGES
jgi:hypothetical protein